MSRFDNDAEVRTTSIPVAAMLIANNFELLKIAPSNRPGVMSYSFSPAARPVVERFFQAKDKLNVEAEREVALENERQRRKATK